MPASRKGRRKVTWEWLVRVIMVDLALKGRSRTAFLQSGCARHGFCPKSHKRRFGRQKMRGHSAAPDNQLFLGGDLDPGRFVLHRLHDCRLNGGRGCRIGGGRDGGVVAVLGNHQIFPWGNGQVPPHQRWGPDERVTTGAARYVRSSLR